MSGPEPAGTVVCVYCGRKGTRAFTLLSGTMDGTRDSWVCSNQQACRRRQRQDVYLGDGAS